MPKRREDAERNRGQTITQTIWCVQALCCCRLRVRELAEKIGCSQRACFRLLGVLRGLGVPVKSEKRGRVVRHYMKASELSAWLAKGRKA